MTAHKSMAFLIDTAEYLAPPLEKSLEAGARRIAANRLKPALDFVGALLGLVLLSPLLLIIGLIIGVETKGGPIFRQSRSGLSGRAFVIYKFRSMWTSEDGDSIGQAVLNDSRVTPFGRFLRRTSLDELPQLLNVLKGEMSLVGPRPHAIAHDIHYGTVLQDYNLRFLTKPGLSGLAQVSGFRGRTPQTSDMAARVAKDLEYIQRWSLWLDLEILLRTPLVFAFHPMAH
jgi:lipopolysaccharide/colanic/teichoic acid biosynthesis glycosyltransferase